MADDPRWLKLAVAVVTRVVYFVIGFLAPILFVLILNSRSPWAAVWHWLRVIGVISLALGAIAAVFGPCLYRRMSTRGMRELASIRKRSERTSPRQRER